MSKLPEGWKAVRLEEVCSPTRIGVNPRTRPGEPYVGLEHIEAHTTRLISYGDTKDVRSTSYEFQPGDTLYSRLRPYLNKVYWAEFRGLASGEFIIFRKVPWLAPRFLKYLLSQPKFVDFTSLLDAGDRPRVRWDQIGDFEFLLPPTAEQERIVAAIEEEFSRVDAGMAALMRVREKLKEMRAAVLQAAVTGNLVPHNLTADPDDVLLRISRDRLRAWKEHTNNTYKLPTEPVPFPLAIPNHWRIASLEAITHPVRVICYGILMPKQNVTDGVPYVRVKDMKGWTIDVAGLRRTSRKIADQYARASLKTGDLLLAIRGSYGRVAIVPEELDGANITQDSARIAAHDAIDRRYLLYYLGGNVANRYYHRVARGVAVKGVNIGDLRSMPVPVPPRDEQTAIADEVERHFTFLHRIEVAVEVALRRGSSLRAASLRSAFSGRLVPQNPKDESASLLVERIAAERASVNGHK